MPSRRALLDQTPAGMAYVVIDAGWQADGDTVVACSGRYGAPKVDVAIVTHPDGDHIGGMGKVFDRLSVDSRLLSRIHQRGGGDSPSGQSRPGTGGEGLRAEGQQSPSPNLGFDWGEWRAHHPGPGAMSTTTSSSPEELGEASASQKTATLCAPRGVQVTDRSRSLTHLPIEVPFDDGPGADPRNNSSVITLLRTRRQAGSAYRRRRRACDQCRARLCGGRRA